MSSSVKQRPPTFDVAYRELTDKLAHVGEGKVGGVPRETDELDRHGLKPISLAQSALAEERLAVDPQLLALVHASSRIRAEDPRDVFGKGGGGGS